MTNTSKPAESAHAPKVGISKIAALINGIIAIVAIFPGLTVIFLLAEIPPTLQQLIRAVSFSVIIVVLISVFLLRQWIVKLKNNVAALMGLAAVVTGAISLTAYWVFANDHVISIDYGPDRPRDLHIVPLRPSQAIIDRIRPYDFDYEEAIRTSTQRETLKQLMSDQSTSSVVVMILLLIASYILLIAPVVAAAWKLLGAPALAAVDD